MRISVVLFGKKISRCPKYVAGHNEATVVATKIYENVGCGVCNIIFRRINSVSGNVGVEIAVRKNDENICCGIFTNHYLINYKLIKIVPGISDLKLQKI